ncbi:MAG: DUF1320 family protein [Nevskia sp.]|jgi:phage gp36-like protein|nr:DUF1320 family protein [Nevskia sp.]MCK9385057.1 DUF1320 family protein [Nevskia sp.]
MSYATREDYISRFGATELLQLVDRDRDGLEDAGVLDNAIADASAEIDTYLVSRYALPLIPIPPVLVRVCCDITRYRLFDDRALDEVRNRYTDAVKYLTNIANGTIKLGLDPSPATNGDDPSPDFTTGDRVFSSTLLADY